MIRYSPYSSVIWCRKQKLFREKNMFSVLLTRKSFFPKDSVYYTNSGTFSFLSQDNNCLKKIWLYKYLIFKRIFQCCLLYFRVEIFPYKVCIIHSIFRAKVSLSEMTRFLYISCLIENIKIGAKLEVSGLWTRSEVPTQSPVWADNSNILEQQTGV